MERLSIIYSLIFLALVDMLIHTVMRRMVWMKTNSLLGRAFLVMMPWSQLSAARRPQVWPNLQRVPAASIHPTRQPISSTSMSTLHRPITISH